MLWLTSDLGVKYKLQRLKCVCLQVDKRQCMWMNSRSVIVDDRTQNSASHREKSSRGDLTLLDRNSISFSTLSYKACWVQHSCPGRCVCLWLMEQKVWGLPKVLKGTAISHVLAVCFKCWNYDFIDRLVDQQKKRSQNLHKTNSLKQRRRTEKEGSVR